MMRGAIDSPPGNARLSRAIAVVRRHLLPATNDAWFALAATLLLGLVLRILVSPGTPVHANNHGIEEIRGLVEYSLRAERHDPYGNTFFFVMNGLLSIFGRNEGMLFLLNRVFGTLAILGIYMLAKALRFSELGAIFAALLLCLSPSQVWISGTESQMVLHLSLALTGLSLLIASVRTSDPLLSWSAAGLIALASSMHVATVALVPVAVVFALSAGLRQAMRENPSYRRHILACLAVGAMYVSLHALSLNMDSLARGINDLGFARNLAAWASVENILWDPTLTPIVVPPLAFIGAFLLLRRRADLVFPLFCAAVLIIPLSFSVCACRTDALRYQSPTHWIYYLLAAFPFSGVLAGPRSASRFLPRGAIFLLGATAAAGLFLLATGSENIQEYRFMREVAAVVPQNAAIWLPTRAALGHFRTEFPDYLHEQFLIKGNEADPFPRPRDRWLYMGLDCYKSESPEDEIDPASGLRKECRSACAGTRKLVMEKTLDARRPKWGYQQPFHRLSTERPVVGLYRCAAAAVPSRRRALDCASGAQRDSGVIRLTLRRYRETGLPRRALGILNGLDEPCPGADLLLDFADNDAKTGRWDEALSALGLAQELKPNAEQKRRMDALRSLLDAFADADRLRRWVGRLKDWGLPVPGLVRQAGLRYVERARRFELNAEQRGWAAIVCQDLEDYRQAYEILDQLVDEQPSEARWRNDRGVLLSLMGKPEEAAADLEAAIALAPDLLETYLSLGSLYVSMNRRKEALDVFRKALSRPRAKEDEEIARRILAESGKVSL